MIGHLTMLIREYGLSAIRSISWENILERQITAPSNSYQDSGACAMVLVQCIAYKISNTCFLDNTFETTLSKQQYLAQLGNAHGIKPTH